MGKDKCKYYSYETFKARIFFDIKETGDYQLMCPKPSVKVDELKSIFWQVYNDWFRKLENKEAERYIQLDAKIKYYEITIPHFRKILEFLWDVPPVVWELSEGKTIWTEQVNAVNAYLDEPIDVDGILVDEFQKALNISIGIMEIEMNEAKIEFESMSSKSGQVSKEFSFEDDLQNINEWNAPQSISYDCYLPEYVAASKSRQKKQQRERLKQVNNGK